MKGVSLHWQGDWPTVSCDSESISRP